MIARSSFLIPVTTQTTGGDELSIHRPQLAHDIYCKESLIDLFGASFCYKADVILYYIILYYIILYYIILYYCTWNEKKIQKLSGLTWHVNIHRPSMLNSTCPVKIFNHMKYTVCYNVFWIVKMCLLLTWKRTTPQSWLFMTFLTDLIYTLFSHIYLAHLRIR